MKAKYANDAAPMDGRQNAEMRMISVDGDPHLVLFAKTDIEPGEEIRYDYGVPDLPWRQKRPLNADCSPTPLLPSWCVPPPTPGQQIRECYVSLRRFTEKELKVLQIKGNTETPHQAIETSLDNENVQSKGKRGLSVDEENEVPAGKYGSTEIPHQAMETSVDNENVQSKGKKGLSVDEENEVPAGSHGSTETPHQAMETSVDNENVQSKGKKGLSVDEENEVPAGSHGSTEIPHQAMETSVDNENVQSKGKKGLSVDEENTVPAGSHGSTETPHQAMETSVDNENVQSKGKKGLSVDEENEVPTGSHAEDQNIQNLLAVTDEGFMEKNVTSAPDLWNCEITVINYPTTDETLYVITPLDGSIETPHQAMETFVDIENVQSKGKSGLPVDEENEVPAGTHGSTETPQQAMETSVDNENVQSKGKRGLSVDEENEVPAGSHGGRKTKPHRPCPYCGEFKSALSNHLKAKHADEEEVKEALKLPKMDRIRAFASLRKKGIFSKNVEMIKASNESKPANDLIRERKQGSSDIIYCSSCLAYITKSHFPKHKRICEVAERSTVSPQSMPINRFKESDNFRRYVLDKFHCDEIGKLIRTNNLIKSYGQREYDRLENKINKTDEKRKNIMTDMRQFARLFADFRDVYIQEGGVKNVEQLTADDMFDRSNFRILESAIYSLTKDDDTGKMKPGLKLYIGNLIKKIIKFIKGEYLTEQRDAEADEMDRLHGTLMHHWNSIFSDAENAIELKRQNVLRKPRKLPKESDVMKLRKYTIDTIEELGSDASFCFFGESEFSRLRDALVCRLTLFNARRGGEPSRLLLSEWTDAVENEWVKESDLNKVADPIEKLCAIEHRLAYQAGKRGGQLVPLLIPQHCMKGMAKLADAHVREDAGVLESNKFMFPSLRSSDKHTIGWHCVAKCAKAANLENHFNATENRHLVATYYAAMDVKEGEKELFYQHMGHSENINKHIYQCPPGVQEATKVAKYLHAFDEGLTNRNDEEKEKLTQFELKEFLKELAGNEAAERALNNQGLIEEHEVETKPELLMRHAAYMCDSFLQESAKSYFTEDGWLVASTTLDTLQGFKIMDDVEDQMEVTADIEKECSSNGDKDEMEVCETVNVVPCSASKRKTAEKMEGSKRQKRSNVKCSGNYRWNKVHTERIKQHFKEYILNTDNFDNKGSLPSVTAMKHFLEENKDILAGFDAANRERKLRTKIFNERKTLRKKTASTLKCLKCK